MKIPALRRVALLAVCSLTCVAAMHAAETASGVVFDDRNANGRRDVGEPGIPGVPVSNGRDVVVTDADGTYALAVDDDTIVFVIKPSDWKVPVSEQTRLPRHFYIHKPAGSPASKYRGVPATGPLPRPLDFPLLAQPQLRKFRVVCLGDTQPRDQREVDYISHDIVEELVGIDAAFGVTLGDLVFDDLNVLEPVARSIGLIGIPWHHVIGNHDLNFDTSDALRADETYERIFGPSYYAFNEGQAHFIVLNNIFWEVDRKTYHAELGERQLAFVENDLRHVPANHLVVFLMHIPLVDVRDKDKLFALVKDRPHTFSLSAHWHTQQHIYVDTSAGWLRERPHHHLVQGTACGAWWTGQLDEVGIPHATMADGTPNGYSIITFDGNRYHVEYKVARRPAEYQMNITAPEVVDSSASETTEVVVNVFAGSERSRVSMRFADGPWTEMKRFKGKDPSVVAMKRREQAMARQLAEARGIEKIDDKALANIIEELQDLRGRGLRAPADTEHLWKGMLPADPPEGYHLIHVRTTDQFGTTYEAHRVIRVGKASPPKRRVVAF